MAPKLFITGATGYIGGDAFYLISKTHPDWEITALVRSSDKGAKIAASYPKVRLVYGDLDSSALLEEESSRADIVYHFAHADHVGAAQSIARGLARRRAVVGDGNPAYWIHVSGTGILSFETSDKKAGGEELPKVYDDWEGIAELTSLPDHAPHRNVDKIVLATATPSQIHTAIVAPPTIYGAGRGPDNQTSIQVPRAAATILKEKRGVRVGAGKNVWHQVHVQDLSKLFLALGEAAVDDPTNGRPATWNERGYYLAENGHPFAWGDVMAKITQEAHKAGFVSESRVEGLSPAEYDKLLPYGTAIVGYNSRGTAVRAGKVLGWTPTMPLLDDTVADTVEAEARKLGLVTGHREKVEKEAQ